MSFLKNRDYLIVGGGVIGLSLARALRKKSGGKITLIERGTIGGAASFAAAGMLAPQAEAEKADHFFNFCRGSRDIYSEFASELFDETGVDIELEKSGTLYLAFNERDAEQIKHRFEWQTEAGLEVEFLTAQETRKAEPFVSPDAREGLFFPNDWQVENRKLISALRKFAEINDIEIVENAAVKSILIEKGKTFGAETFKERFYCENVVLATGAWTSVIETNENVSLPEVKPIRGQMLAFQTAKRLYRRVIYSPRGYLVPRLDGRILVGATVEDAGFQNKVTENGVNFLLQTASEIAPNLANLQPNDKWSGLRPMSPDGLPILGSVSEAENLIIATAHYRNGILLAPLTAEILANKIIDKTDSEYLKIFSPRRFFN